MKQIDAALVHYITTKYRHRSFWANIDDILPHVVFEILALGPEAVLYVWKRAAKLKLDDGHVYNIKYEHASHGIVLNRMEGLRKVGEPFVITVETSPQEVWAALNPQAARKQAA